jgi:formylglycine-generating enzyme required for sulfatase activity
MKTNLDLTCAVLLSVLWLLVSLPLQTQVFQESSPVQLRAKISRYPAKSVVNDNLTEFHHNNHFRTAVSKYSPVTKSIWYDTAVISSILKEEVQTPLKMPDFVYFDPLEYFQHPEKEYLTKTRRPIREVMCFHRIRYVRSFKPQIVKHSIPAPIPYALRFYLDTAHITAVPGQTRLYLSDEANLLPEPFLKPFYFRKYLVSNAEYREFVNYVKDSIARTILFEAGLKQYGRMVTHLDAQGKETQMLLLDYAPPIYWNDEKTDTLLAVMYVPEHERYYQRKQINSAILKYESPTYYQPLSPLNIYPDTSVWMRDFPESFMEPWTKNYFWHPAYDHYPVVGVSYWQALAYLDWKTRQLQQDLDRKGMGIRVVCDLPTEAEWEMVATADHVDRKPALYPLHYDELADQSWMTSLQLTFDWVEQIDSTDQTLWLIHQRPNLLNKAFEGPSRTSVWRSLDESVVTHPTGQYAKKRVWKKSRSPLYPPDPNGIFHMGSNVSEWLKDTYAEQWLPVFTRRQEMLSSFTDPEMVLLAQLEQYYNTLNDTNGRLVRGANWHDRRYFSLYGKNISGMQAKRFVSPDKAHPTLGFRYVMRFEYEGN